MRLVPNDPNPIAANRFMAGDLLYFKLLEGCRDVLSDAIWGGVPGEVVEHVVRRLAGKHSGMPSLLSEGLCAGLSARH